MTRRTVNEVVGTLDVIDLLPQDVDQQAEFFLKSFIFALGDEWTKVRYMFTAPMYIAHKLPLPTCEHATRSLTPQAPT
jgi:hypothetical protein